MSTDTVRFVDAHCHLDEAYFHEGPESVMRRARDAGVVGFVVVGLAGEGDDARADALRSVRFAVDRVRADPQTTAACVGVHPHDARCWTPDLHAHLRAIASGPEVAAVGEIGLDYHYDHSPREVQRDVFARLIGLARELGKPIVVHTRSAPDDTLSILASEQARDVGGIIHCFSEDRRFAERALELGFDLSFSGIVTFKNAHAIRDVAAWVPLDRMLVETDSPYLAPVPFRGKRCEPAYVVHTARCIADLRKMPLEELALATCANAQRRFDKTFR